MTKNTGWTIKTKPFCKLELHNLSHDEHFSTVTKQRRPNHQVVKRQL